MLVNDVNVLISVWQVGIGLGSSTWNLFDQVENFLLLSKEEGAVNHVVDSQTPGYSVGEVNDPDWGLMLEGVVFFSIQIITHVFVDQSLEVSTNFRLINKFWKA